MGKPKCKECNGCMDYEWVDHSRFLHCAFCRTYYAGQIKELYLVENPYLIRCVDCGGDGSTYFQNSEINISPYSMGICPTCNGKGKIDRRLLESRNEHKQSPQ